MEHKENPETEEKVREKVLIPLKRHESIEVEEDPDNQKEKIWKMPRRWLVH